MSSSHQVDENNEEIEDEDEVTHLMAVRMVGTLPETNSLPLKMDGWNTSFLLGWPIFRCYVSFREYSSCAWRILLTDDVW